MTTTTVTSTSALLTALGSAHAGDTIYLAPGNYAAVDFYNTNFTGGQVTITSLNPSNPAVLAGIDMSYDSGITFSNLTIDGVGTSLYQYVNLDYGTNINFNNLTIEGSDPNPVNDAGGFNIGYSTNVTLTNSTLTQLAVGGGESYSTNVTISNNTFTDIECDGIDNAGSSNVTISGNYFTNFYPATGDHPDAIQFWTTNTTSPTSNIIVSDNTAIRGSGAAIQGIDFGDSSLTLPYNNVQVTGNHIIGEGYNGIMLQNTPNAVVSNNVVQGYSDEQSWIRLMNMDSPVVTNNQAGEFIYESTVTNLSQSGNTILAQIPVPTGVTGTGTVTVGSGTTTTTASPPPPPPPTASPPPPPPPPPPPAVAPSAPTGLSLDASTATGAAGSNVTKDAKLVIDGTAAPGSQVTLYDGTTVIGTGAANATTGAFSIQATSALASGAHTLTATDTSGGLTSSASTALTVTIDTTPATATIGQVSSSINNVTISGTSSDAVSGVAYTVSIYQDGKQIATVTPTNGAWSFTEKNAGIGPHTYTVATTDAAGNQAAGADNVILGVAGNERIVAGAGANIIMAGSGDTMTGGSGTNAFIFNSVAAAATGHRTDVVTNWVSGSDHINLTGLGHLTFDGNTQTVAPHSVEWYVAGGNTYIVGDGVGHSKADFMIELLGVHNLSASDFVLS